MRFWGNRRVLSVAVAAMTLAVGQASAQSWSKKILAGAARFKVLPQFGSQAVLDKETGLVWERQPSSAITDWDSAGVRCHELSLGNRLGWRLPSVEELASLVDPTQPAPALTTNHPFQNVQNAEYWSATTFPLNSGEVTYARTVNFSVAQVTSEEKTSTKPTWCVRSGQGVDGN